MIQTRCRSPHRKYRSSRHNEGPARRFDRCNQGCRQDRSHKGHLCFRNRSHVLSPRLDSAPGDKRSFPAEDRRGALR